MLRTASLVTQSWASLPSGRSYFFLTALLIWLALSLCIYLQRRECVWWESTGSLWDGGIIQLPSPLRSCRQWKEKEDSWCWTFKKITKTPTSHSELENLSTSLLMGDTQKENPENSVTPWVGLIAGIQNMSGQGIRARQVLKIRWGWEGQEQSGALQNALWQIVKSTPGCVDKSNCLRLRLQLDSTGSSWML